MPLQQDNVKNAYCIEVTLKVAKTMSNNQVVDSHNLHIIKDKRNVYL